MRADAQVARGAKPVVFTDIKRGDGVKQVINYIISQGGLQD